MQPTDRPRDHDLNLELAAYRLPALTLPASLDAPAHASMLLNLGGFLRDLGGLMQRQADPQPVNAKQQQKYLDAKAALIDELKRLLRWIAQDARLTLDERIDKGREIGEMIGMLRVCSLEGMNRAVLAIGIIIPAVPAEQTDAWRLMFWWTCLAAAKKTWDDHPSPPGQPANANRVEYDAVQGSIVVWAGGVLVSAYPVDAAKADEARRKAAELQDIYTRCDYPDKAFAEAITALRQP